MSKIKSPPPPPSEKKYSNLLGNPDGRKLCKNYIKYGVI